MAQGQDWILTLNAGSSSLKFAAYDICGQKQLASGQIAAIGASAKLLARGEEAAVEAPDHQAALEQALLSLRADGVEGVPVAVGHRVVHGGARNRAARITPDVRADIERAAELAPLHNPPALKVMDALNQTFTQVPQVACFDTAFHGDNPKEATVIPLPVDYRRRGIRRYGFHGLSFASLVRRFGGVTRQTLPRRVLALHLGAGASLAAIVEGKGVATSMGFSPMDGLVMATRSGAMDPGVLLHLMRTDGLDADALDELLNKKSGLWALSGGETDMKVLLARDDPEARFAISHYCYWASRHAGSMIAAMQGLDGVIFTGGIGENAAPIRKMIMGRLSWAFGNGLSAARGGQADGAATSPRSWVIAADEEGEIAHSTRAVLG